MKKILLVLLIFCFSLTITSCSEDEEEYTTDTTSPVIAEVTAVTTPTNDTTPDYTFSSTEDGTITYGGSCSSETSSANNGNNTITLIFLSYGTHLDCTIIVKDSAGNASNELLITSFEVLPSFFSVGSGIVLKSSDGSTWNSVSTVTSDNGGDNSSILGFHPSQTLNDISYGDSTYVIVGSNYSGSTGSIYTSSDGTTWTLRSSGTTKRLYGIMY